MSILKSPVLIDEQKNTIEFLDSRFYLSDEGEWYPSCTTILDAYPKSASFYEWLKKVGDNADDIRDEAGRRGSKVHNLTEAYDNGEEINILDGVGRPQFKISEWSMFERWVEFNERFNPKIIYNELPLVSPNLGFGGCIDRILYLKDRKILVDIKTSNTVHSHYWLQLSAYAKLLEDVMKETVDDICICWLNAKTRTEGRKNAIQGIGWQLVFPDKDIEYYWNLFKATQCLWNEEHGGEKPRNLIYSLKHKK